MYLRQFAVILLFSLAGDVCHAVLPFPIPAAIYGLVLMFLAFSLKILRLEAVKETGKFLVSALQLLFVVPAVGVMEYWPLIRDNLLQILILVVVTTAITFGVSGLLTKAFRKEERDHA